MGNFQRCEDKVHERVRILTRPEPVFGERAVRKSLSRVKSALSVVLYVNKSESTKCVCIVLPTKMSYVQYYYSLASKLGTEPSLGSICTFGGGCPAVVAVPLWEVYLRTCLRAVYSGTPFSARVIDPSFLSGILVLCTSS